MQQLIHWQLTDTHLTANSATSMDESWFNQWCESVNSHSEIQMVEINHGADRHQCIFRFEDHLFLMQVELLCEAVWIEPAEQSNLLVDTLDRLKELCQGMN